MILVPRQRDSPGLTGATDREVLEALLDEAPRLVGAEAGQDEVRPLLVEREQPVLVGREPEEVVLLLDVLDVSVIRALAVDKVGLRLERLTADAVEPRVDALVDVTVVVDPLEEVANESLVPLVRRPDEEVRLRADPTRELSPDLGDTIDVLLRPEAFRLGDTEHLRRMLVHSGEEERLGAALALVPDDDVGRDRRVRVPDVRRRVHVVDRCRQVEAHCVGF